QRLAKGVERRRELLDGAHPRGKRRVRSGAKAYQRIGITVVQNVWQQVLQADNVVDELALKHEVGRIRIPPETLGQVRRQVLEIILALIGRVQHAGGQSRERRGFLHRGIIEDDALEIIRLVNVVGGDRLLIKNLDAGLTANLRQSVDGSRQRLTSEKVRYRLAVHKRRPNRTVNDVLADRVRGSWVAKIGSMAIERTKVRHNSAHGRRVIIRPIKIALVHVVKAHGEAVARRGRLGQERRTADIFRHGAGVLIGAIDRQIIPQLHAAIGGYDQRQRLGSDRTIPSVLN